jgi:hypothetical protein
MNSTIHKFDNNGLLPKVTAEELIAVSGGESYRYFMHEGVGVIFSDSGQIYYRAEGGDGHLRKVFPNK